MPRLRQVLSVLILAVGVALVAAQLAPPPATEAGYLHHATRTPTPTKPPHASATRPATLTVQPAVTRAPDCRAPRTTRYPVFDPDGRCPVD
jgi:hypothetical protein